MEKKARRGKHNDTVISVKNKDSGVTPIMGRVITNNTTISLLLEECLWFVISLEIVPSSKKDGQNLKKSKFSHLVWLSG